MELQSLCNKKGRKYLLKYLCLRVLVVLIFLIIYTIVIQNRPKVGWTIMSQGNELSSTMPSIQPQDAIFQPVNDTTVHVYSAFLERRILQPAVRVIAVGKQDTLHCYEYIPWQLLCLLRLLDGRKYELAATVEVIKENHGLPYTGMFIMCDLKYVDPQEAVGASIAVMKSGTVGPPTNQLTVLDTTPVKGTDISNTFHLCLQIFNSSLLQGQWFLEWMELNHLLGITHFHFYSYLESQKRNPFLDYYHSKGMVSLHVWNIPVPGDTIWSFGQSVALNDCVYRSMSSAGWIVNVDLDEVLVPRRARTLPDLVKAINEDFNLNSYKPSAYNFRNAFFYLFWKDDTEPPAPLLTAKKTKRSRQPYKAKIRSKYMARPQDVVEVGAHYVKQFLQHIYYKEVPIYMGLLHHYRKDCPAEGEREQCVDQVFVVDRTAHNYSKELMHRFNMIMKAIENK